MYSMEKELHRFVVDNFLYGRDSGFSDNESFVDMGILDSTGMLELVGFLEKKYGIEVRDVDLTPDNLDSVTQLAEFLRRRLVRPGAAVPGTPHTQAAYSD